MERLSALLILQAASFGIMIPTGPSTGFRMTQLLCDGIPTIVLASPQIGTET